MKIKDYLVIAVICSAFFPQSAAAVVIFQDNFNGPNRNTVGNGWSEIERSNNDVAVRNGVLRLRDQASGGIDAAASQLNGFSTLGLANIMLSYEWGASNNTESSDTLFVEWRVSDVHGWTGLVQHVLGGSGLLSNAISLGAAAANQSDIEFRFYTNVSTSSERALLDNIILSGVAAAVSEPTTLSLLGFGCALMLIRRRKRLST